MGFDAISRDLTASVFNALGDEAVFTPAGGAPIALRAQLNPATTVVGELGHYADPRPSIALPGHARQGASARLIAALESRAWR